MAVAGCAVVQRVGGGGVRGATARGQGRPAVRVARPIGAEHRRAEELGLASRGALVMAPVQSFRGTVVAVATRARGLIVECGKRKSILKRIRTTERDRLLNKARKTRVKNTVKAALSALEALNEDESATEESTISDAEKLISEAFKAIDMAKARGVLHNNTANRRKTRMARMKKKVQIAKGWYTPAAKSET